MHKSEKSEKNIFSHVSVKSKCIIICVKCKCTNEVFRNVQCGIVDWYKAPNGKS